MSPHRRRQRCMFWRAAGKRLASRPVVLARGSVVGDTAAGAIRIVLGGWPYSSRRRERVIRGRRSVDRQPPRRADVHAGGPMVLA